MLPADFIFLAIGLRLASGASYLYATWHGKARPSLVSWSFWSLTALIAFVIELSKGSGRGALITLAIGISPLAVCIAALYRRTAVTELTRLDKWCIALTLAGIALWLSSKNPLTMLYMSIVADVCSNLPTLRKAYRAPHTEHATAYALTITSMTVALLTISDWRLMNWLFSAYILAINVAIVLTITVFSKLRSRLPGWKTIQAEEPA